MPRSWSVSLSGITAITRAYAKIIAETDDMPIGALREGQRGR
jgi:hypothetical protein